MGRASSSRVDDPARTADGALAPARGMMLTLITVTALVAIVSSLGAPLIPSIAHSDGVSLSTAEWLLTAALMTGALATPVMGRIADGPSKRGVVAVALTAVLSGCVVSALSTSFTQMVVGRGLQGFGLGLLPVTMAIARSHFPPARAGRAVATLSVTGAAGAGLGYPLTSLMAQAFDYRAAFWFGAITVGLALLLAMVVLPARSPGEARRFDLPGAVLLGSAVIGVCTVLSEGADWGWVSGRSLAVAAGTATLAAAWIWRELATTDPLVDVRQVRNRSVLTADISGFLMAVSMYLFLPIVVEFVQIPASRGYGFGASLLMSGMILVPLSIGSFLASRCLVAYQRRWGTRSMIPFGAMIFAGSSMFFALGHRALWEAFAAMGLAGLGIGFTFAAMPGFIVRAVPVSETGSAMGFYQVLRSIGLAVGSALAAAILTAKTAHGAALPSFSGFHLSLVVAACLAIATAVLSYLVPGRVAEDPGTLTAPVERLMEEEAEVGGTAFSLTDGSVVPSMSGAQVPVTETVTGGRL